MKAPNNVTTRKMKNAESEKLKGGAEQIQTNGTTTQLRWKMKINGLRQNRLPKQ